LLCKSGFRSLAARVPYPDKSFRAALPKLNMPGSGLDLKGTEKTKKCHDCRRSSRGTSVNLLKENQKNTRNKKNKAEITIRRRRSTTRRRQIPTVSQIWVGRDRHRVTITGRGQLSKIHSAVIKV
jgi:hypothetical protein